MIISVPTVFYFWFCRT